MGCWNETCGISQLPITYGDKCRVFLIVKQDYKNEKRGGGYCYPHDLWYPRGLPIIGTYDEYGGLEDKSIVQDINCKIIVDGLKQDWADYTPQHQWDDTFKADDLDIHTILTAAAQDKAQIHDGHSPRDDDRIKEMLSQLKSGETETSGVPFHEYADERGKRWLGIMFVLEEVYQTMIGHNPVDADHNFENGSFLYKPIFEIFNDKMEKWYKDKLKFSKNRKKDGEIGKLWNSFDEILDRCDSIGYSDPPFCKGLSYYYRFLRQKAYDGVAYDDPEVQTVANGVVDFSKFVHSLSAARKSWIPQSGKGSQRAETGIYKALAQTTLLVCQKRDNECDEYHDETTYSKWMLKHNEEELKKLSEKKNVKKGKQVPAKKR